MKALPKGVELRVENPSDERTGIVRIRVHEAEGFGEGEVIGRLQSPNELARDVILESSYTEITGCVGNRPLDIKSTPEQVKILSTRIICSDWRHCSTWGTAE